VLQTQASIDAEINTKLPSNDTGAVTAAALRQVLHDMNAATFQVAGSQGLINSVFRYGAAGDGTTDDAHAFNAALAANGNVIAPPASYAIAGAAVTIPFGGTLETYPGAGMTYSGPGTLLIAPGGAFITKGYGDQHDGWLWARSTRGPVRSPRTRSECSAAPAASTSPSSTRPTTGRPSASSTIS
jgi:hypothetical protein